MSQEENSPSWQQQSQEADQAMQEWRRTHPQATLAEIERAVDEHMNHLRARMIEEMAQAGSLEQAKGQGKLVKCPQCGTRMQRRGKRQRRLQTQGGQEVTLTREYQSCPQCGYSFFPPG